MPPHIAPETATPAPPNFSHVAEWVFDLDNTLYSAASEVFPQIDRRMRMYLAEMLEITEDAAHEIQKRYYREHGTTLSGLVKLHDIDPHAYLEYVHDIDLGVIGTDASLRAALARLPGRRLVFTNGSVAHAGRVLERLGIADLFDDVFDIVAAAFIPKPDHAAFASFIARHGVAPREAAMFEDMARNLVPAHALGMTTVLLKTDAPWTAQGPQSPAVAAHHIHYETDDLAAFLAAIQIAERP